MFIVWAHEESVNDYLRRFKGPVLWPEGISCPGCGSPMRHKGLSKRQLHVDGGFIDILLFRFRCPDGACPVKTGTLYPDFVAPGTAYRTREQEDLLRRRAAGTPLKALAADLGVSLKTVSRWCRRAEGFALSVAPKLARAIVALAPGRDPVAQVAASGLETFFSLADDLLKVLGWEDSVLVLSRKVAAADGFL